MTWSERYAMSAGTSSAGEERGAAAVLCLAARAVSRKSADWWDQRGRSSFRLADDHHGSPRADRSPMRPASRSSLGGTTV